MNYRQWKKNYKKKHGYNPPLMEDKRQMKKALKLMLRKCSQMDVVVLWNSIVDELEKIFRATADVFNNMADGLKGE